MKWFTKGKYLPPVSIFDPNRSASKKKMCSKLSIFQSCQKTFPLLINDNEEGPSGGPREKLINFY